MAYVGATPWHGLGQQLPEGQTIEQWMIAAGMNYSVNRATVQYMNGSLHSFPGKYVLYRSDDNRPLGVVSDGYKIVQPSEVLELFRDLCDKQGFALETAGVLKGGALYWALAQTGHDAEVTPGDRSKGYVLLSTSADGSRATDARFTAIRVVCNNTITVAMRAGQSVATSHRSVFSAAATKQALGLVSFDESWNEFTATMRQLADIQVSANRATEFFSELLRPRKAATVPAGNVNLGASTFAELLTGNASIRDDLLKTEGRAIRGLSDLENSYYKAPGAVPGTAYGLLQGVTHFVDHVRGTSADKRLTSAWFAHGNTMKQAAVDLALAI